MKTHLENGLMNLFEKDFFSRLWAVIYLRLRLLLRQKLGWISLTVGAFMVFLSLIVARVSYVNPEKIFWDFSLSISFIMQMALAIYLGSQFFSDEKERRTLHLILSAGVSRGSWVVGNAVGIWLGLLAMNVFWYLTSILAAWLIFPEGLSLTMQTQAQMLLGAEILIVILMSFFFSLILRPLLALAVSAVLCIFLHSADNLTRVFTDQQVGRYIDDRGYDILTWIARLFPPLHWLDLKPLVGYEHSISWSLIGGLGSLAFLWALFFGVASVLRFEKMDI